MKHGCLFLLLSCVTSVWAQSPDSTYASSFNGPAHRPHVLLKLSPLSLIDVDATVQGAVEVRTGRRTSVQGEFGYGWPGFAPTPWARPGHNRSLKEVWRGRLEARLYRDLNRLPRRRYRMPTTFPIGRYWAFEGVYKQLNVLESRQIAVGCTTGACPPGDVFIRPATRQAVAAHLKVGWQWPVGQSDGGWSRCLIDSYMGIGPRLVWISQPTPFPDGHVDEYRPADGFITEIYGFRPAPAQVGFSLSLGFRISYLF